MKYEDIKVGEKYVVEEDGEGRYYYSKDTIVKVIDKHEDDYFTVNGQSTGGPYMVDQIMCPDQLRKIEESDDV